MYVDVDVDVDVDVCLCLGSEEAWRDASQGLAEPSPAGEERPSWYQHSSLYISPFEQLPEARWRQEARLKPSLRGEARYMCVYIYIYISIYVNI